MKVLHLCGKDFWGAGRAAYRLHKGLLEAGVDSKMWVGAKRTDDDTVVDIQAGKWNKKLTKVYLNLEKVIIKLKAKGTKEMFSLGKPAHSVRSLIKKEKPDIIHLHWINRGFMQLKDLKNLNIPVVISLHDMWWFTGGCHYDEECSLYTRACGNCPVLVRDGEIGLSFRHLAFKREVLKSVDKLTLVGLSNWMKESAQCSLIGSDQRVINLPNGLNVDNFAPQDKFKSREKLGLPKDKKLIMFAAVDALSESRKGYQYISKALSSLNDQYEVIVIGEKSSAKEVSGLKAYFPGEIKDDQLMVDYMSAADVAVVPSLQENLSNMILESLSCGTPVVAFNVGGNGDMIVHQQNGYLAQLRDTKDLADGLVYCCDESRNEDLSAKARERVLNKFDIRKVALQYKEEYENIARS